MRIKKLALHGFKSFPDRTEVEFHDGLTAIVGPNGCGKSNISDAIRWVLGEQRPTAIRGSRMEEAIFGGTQERRPIHRAEVALTLSNEDGTLPVPYAEVVIGRTVYRGGESEYSLNGSVCRLKDIQDLCRDTGLGANEYAVIEGRMIDAILSDRAEERRALFEEAAEIGRYKDRRRTALRRLEQADGDLQRLDDVLAEVQSKVRSLAAQRGRAERHGRLRSRLLRLEVAVADARLARTARRLEEAEAELAELRDLQPAEEAELRTAETEAESLRIELAERERERAALARRAEEVRRQLEERERERLVAAEREAAARQRIEAIGEELAQLDGRRSALDEATAEAAEAVEAARERVEALVASEAERRQRLEERDRSLREAEEAEATARERLGKVLREVGLLEAEREAADERVGERGQELERRRQALTELERLEEELADRRAEADAAEAEAAGRVEGSTGELEAARSRLEEVKGEVRRLREREAELEGLLSTARARASSLEGFLEEGGGLPSVVRALTEAGLPGVEGPLAGHVRAPAALGGAVEAHLGAYLHAVVVRDWEAVERVRSWLGGRDEDEALVLLPLDPGPRRAAEGGVAAGDAALLDRVEAVGPGAPWVRALLSGVAVRQAGAGAPARGAWVEPAGSGQDAWGAVRLGRPGSGRGTLSRRGELERLREREAALREEREAASSRREAVEEELAGAARAADRLEERLAEASRRRREAAAERDAADDRLERLQREREELRARVVELEASRESAATRAEAGARRLQELGRRRREAEEAVAAARARTAEAREAWEAERARLHELELERTRRQADLEAARERRGRAEADLEAARSRRARLEAERETQEEAAHRGRATVEEGEEEVASLLEARRELQERLREAEEGLEAGREDLEGRETALREMRKRERDHAERRHALELEVSELRGRRASLLERLEAEWDAPLEALRERTEPPEEGEPEAWEEELEEVRRDLHRLGPVNMLAEEEYAEEKERLDFLLEQRDDLVEARDDLRDSIRRINRTAAEAFEGTFEQVREHFQNTFRTLFEGGECDLWLEDREEPLDSPIEISASPRGKRTQRIHLLSGGERALTALALLFAIYLAKPSPFCLMDEVDAPLDETNILRFVNMLERFKEETQFIVITHNPRTIEAADWIYGVTMQEPGVSSVVGVTFGEAKDQVA